MQPRDLIDRITDSIEVDANDCWRWQKRIGYNGYGHMWLTTSYGEGSNLGAHRISYTAFIGDIPDGLHIDHLCKVRDCVNPDHLEAVTAQENVHRSDALWKQEARRTHCPQGHEYAGRNLMVKKTSTGISRSCRTCTYARNNARKQKQRLAYAA